MRPGFRIGSLLLQKRLSSLRQSSVTKCFWRWYQKVVTTKILATEDVTEPCRIPMDGEIPKGNTAMRTTIEPRRTLHEVVQEMGSETMGLGSQKTATATIVTLVLQEQVQAAIDTARVGTSSKCRASTKDGISRAIVVAETRSEVVVEVEMQGVVITKTMAAAGVEEVACERAIAVEAAEGEARVEVEVTEMALPDTKV